MSLAMNVPDDEGIDHAEPVIENEGTVANTARPRDRAPERGHIPIPKSPDHQPTSNQPRGKQEHGTEYIWSRNRNREGAYQDIAVHGAGKSYEKVHIEGNENGPFGVQLSNGSGKAPSGWLEKQIQILEKRKELEDAQGRNQTAKIENTGGVRA